MNRFLVEKSIPLSLVAFFGPLLSTVFPFLEFVASLSMGPNKYYRIKVQSVLYDVRFPWAGGTPRYIYATLGKKRKWIIPPVIRLNPRPVVLYP